MLVTFHSKAWTSVTMFGGVAVSLLRMMGHSGAVPSALPARDVPAALDQLQHKLGVAEPVSGNPYDEDEAEPQVALRARAYPLIQMLRASAREEADILWEESRRPG